VHRRTRREIYNDYHKLNADAKKGYELYAELHPNMADLNWQARNDEMVGTFVNKLKAGMDKLCHQDGSSILFVKKAANIDTTQPLTSDQFITCMFIQS